MNLFSRFKIKRIKYPFIEDKRQRFAMQTVILTAGIIITQLIWDDLRFYMVGVLAVCTYILTIWSLYEDVKGVEWVFLFILPVTFSILFSLFYFLLPSRMISRLIVTVLFAIGMYAILLVENIYNVAVSRSIQLLRAAHSVGLLVTLAVIFLGSSVIFSMRLYFWQNALLMIPLTFLLAIQSVWSIKLNFTNYKQLFLYTLGIVLGIGELVIVISFYPASIASISLFLTAAFYVMLGVVHLHISERLFKNTFSEYFYVIIFVIILTIMTSQWG